MVKNLPASAGDARDVGSIPKSGRSPGVEDDNQLQYSSLENSTDREVWRAAVQGATKELDTTELSHILSCLRIHPSRCQMTDRCPCQSTGSWMLQMLPCQHFFPGQL